MFPEFLICWDLDLLLPRLSVHNPLYLCRRGKLSESDSHGLCCNDGIPVLRACQGDCGVLWHASAAHLQTSPAGPAGGLSGQQSRGEVRGMLHKPHRKRELLCMMHVQTVHIGYCMEHWGTNSLTLERACNCFALAVIFLHLPGMSFFQTNFLTHSFVTVGNPALCPADPLICYTAVCGYTNRGFLQLNLFVVGLPGKGGESCCSIVYNLCLCLLIFHLCPPTSSIFYSIITACSSS